MTLALPSQTHLAGLSVLVQDEGHLGAVHTGRQSLACAHVEHGQGGKRPGDLARGRHLPQLLRVPMDGAVVDHLDAGGQARSQPQVHAGWGWGSNTGSGAKK